MSTCYESSRLRPDGVANPDLLLAPLQTLVMIIDHVVAICTQPENPPEPLTCDIGVSYRDRTKNFLPFTSVGALARAYRNNRISKGLYVPLNSPEEIADYPQIRVSQILIHFNREVNRLSLQEANVMAIALAEILSRTLFFHITQNAFDLDTLSLSIYDRLRQFPGYP